MSPEQAIFGLQPVVAVGSEQESAEDDRDRQYAPRATRGRDLQDHADDGHCAKGQGGTAQVERIEMIEYWYD